MIRRPLFLIFACLVCVAAIALLAYRPATVAGVHAGELTSSVQRVAQRTNVRTCAQLAGGHWRCAPFRIVTRGFGCWRATAPRNRQPSVSGCISGLDYVFPAERAGGD
jgi:hypothetical protein